MPAGTKMLGGVLVIQACVDILRGIAVRPFTESKKREGEKLDEEEGEEVGVESERGQETSRKSFRIARGTSFPRKYNCFRKGRR